MLRVGIILSGSGVCDGSEIHESVLSILALDRAGAQIVFMAPNRNQSEVINHQTNSVSHEARNMLIESARIARGQVRDIREVREADLDAVIIPGGFGAAKNLSDFCWTGDKCRVDNEVFRLLREMRTALKPIGAICIAPAILAKTFADEKPKLTIGSDKATIEVLERIGAAHETAQADEIVVDERLQLVTTPGYMAASRISELQTGIDRLVEAVLRRAKKRAAAQPADSATSSVTTSARERRAQQPADSATARIATRARGRAARPVTRRRTVKA